MTSRQQTLTRRGLLVITGLRLYPANLGPHAVMGSDQPARISGDWAHYWYRPIACHKFAIVATIPVTGVSPFVSSPSGQRCGAYPNPL